jgi:hypothetical protein
LTQFSAISLKGADRCLLLQLARVLEIVARLGLGLLQADGRIGPRFEGSWLAVAISQRAERFGAAGAEHQHQRKPAHLAEIGDLHRWFQRWHWGHR